MLVLVWYYCGCEHKTKFKHRNSMGLLHQLDDLEYACIDFLEDKLLTKHANFKFRYLIPQSDNGTNLRIVLLCRAASGVFKNVIFS